MSRVIARCPNCGVEHDDATGGPCEVCGTTLRYWCRLHEAQTGWLDTPECPRCAAEAAERASRPAPPPTAPPRRRTRVPAERPYTPVEPVRDPREVLLEGAEDLRPYVAAGAEAAGRMVRAFFAVVGKVIFFGVLGAIVGGFVAYNQQGDLVWPVISGALIGAGVGFFFGAIKALRIIFAGRRRVR